MNEYDNGYQEWMREQAAMEWESASEMRDVVAEVEMAEAA